MDGELGRGGLDEGTPLNCPRKPKNQWRSALASGPRKMVPVCSVARASKSLEMKILALELGHEIQQVLVVGPS